MPRPSRTGVRGLHRVGRRYRLDIRYHDPVTGEPKRWREWLPAGIKAEVARRYAMAVRDRLLSGRSPEIPLAEITPRYLEWCEVENQSESTRRWKANACRAIERRWGQRFPASIDRPEVSSWKHDLLTGNDHPKSKPRKGTTVNRYLATLRHLYTWMADRKLVGWDAARDVAREPLLDEPERCRDLTPAEERSLLAACSAPLRQAVIIAMDTGLDQGEIVELDWRQHVDLEREEITRPREKTGVDRVVPMTRRVVGALESLCPRDGHRHGAVFRRWDGRPWSQWGLVSAWRRARARAGLEDFRFKDLRHHFATRLLDRGNELVVIRDMLGHSPKSGMRLVMRYAHRRRRLYRKAIKSLE